MLSYFVLAVLAVEGVIGVPNYQECVSDLAKSQKYCDFSLSHAERVEALISSLTLQEKIDQISPSYPMDSCDVITKGAPRVGLGRYMFLVETNTGAASVCMRAGKCATTFIGPNGLGASFNRTLWWHKGDVISTEQRAHANLNMYRAQGEISLIGYDGFGPNINIERDPRFGRNSELPGEDPFLSGQYATSYVRGQQQIDSKGYIKMIAYLKHYTAYSEETNRGHDNHNITTHDYWDTYLRQYQAAFELGNASGVMCSYPAENGQPSCANDFLLNQVMRRRFGHPGAVAMTDCGVVSNMLGPPAYAPTPAHAAAWTINNGTDIEAGTTIWVEHMASAVASGLVKESTIDAALRRVLTQLFQAGRFDPVGSTAWSNYGEEMLNSSASLAINIDAGRQGVVLLQNDGAALPLSRTANIAIVGPQGDAQYGLLSDYYGDQLCYNNSFTCLWSFRQALEAQSSGKILYEMGVTISGTTDYNLSAALKAADQSDVVILALGIDKSIEHEGIDRHSINLPGLQSKFGLAVLAHCAATKKPAVLLLTNGGALAIDEFVAKPVNPPTMPSGYKAAVFGDEPPLGWATASLPSSFAIVEGFNPNTVGAWGIVENLFGTSNRWGRMPYTIYSSKYTSEVDLSDFDMVKAPGRTYRYYTGVPLYPFGYGLSYSRCVVADASIVGQRLHVIVKQSGPTGACVVHVYHRASAGLRAKIGSKYPVPQRTLVDFDRVEDLASPHTVLFKFDINDSWFQFIDNTGAATIPAGQHLLDVWSGSAVPTVITVNRV